MEITTTVQLVNNIVLAPNESTTIGEHRSDIFPARQIEVFGKKYRYILAGTYEIVQYGDEDFEVRMLPARASWGKFVFFAFILWMTVGGLAEAFGRTNPMLVGAIAVAVVYNGLHLLEAITNAHWIEAGTPESHPEYAELFDINGTNVINGWWYTFMNRPYQYNWSPATHFAIWLGVFVLASIA